MRKRPPVLLELLNGKNALDLKHRRTVMPTGKSQPAIATITTVPLNGREFRNAHKNTQDLKREVFTAV
jgi:hypothetical protein